MDYPDKPPMVRFQTPINMACLNQETGLVCSFIYPSKQKIIKPLIITTVIQVEPSLFPMLTNWERKFTMEDILVSLKKEMSAPYNRKLHQPTTQGIVINNRTIVISSHCGIKIHNDNALGNDDRRMEQKDIVLRCAILWGLHMSFCYHGRWWYLLRNSKRSNKIFMSVFVDAFVHTEPVLRSVSKLVPTSASALSCGYISYPNAGADVSYRHKFHGYLTDVVNYNFQRKTWLRNGKVADLMQQ